MTGVSTFFKCVITLAVVFGILYVLISPLPEVDAAFSGKSFLSYFFLVTHAFLGLFFFTFLVRLFPVEWIATPRRDVLKMICVRLC
jgi:Na+/citrate or Na+/malate symporter